MPGGITATTTAVTCTAILAIDWVHRVTTWTALFVRAFLAAVVVVLAAILARHIYLRVAPEADTGMGAVHDTEMPPTFCTPGTQSGSVHHTREDSDTFLLKPSCLES